MPAPETIRIQAIDDFGGPEVFATHEVPRVAPEPGQVAIKVAATSVNPVDLSTRAGENVPIEEARFPMVLGWDVAGTVEEVGDGVSGWAIGDRIAAMSFQPLEQIGTYAERVILDASLLAHLPEGMSFATAATVPLVGLTARQALDSLGLSPGAVLFVNAPVGAVGRMVVQLARRDGIVVSGSVADADSDLARGLGVREIVSRSGDLAAQVHADHPDGVDAAIDLVGGAVAHATIDAVRDGGRYTTVVPPYRDATGPFEPMRGIEPKVIQVEPDAAALEPLLTAVQVGELESPIDSTMALADAAEAHRRLAAGGLRGKIVLVP